MYEQRRFVCGRQRVELVEIHPEGEHLSHSSIRCVSLAQIRHCAEFQSDKWQHLVLAKKECQHLLNGKWRGTDF
jgi:hypothetical protein